ncbi:MAG: RnfABCDGE type electron transport complex subunit D [Clostridia bacterium]|nr:RnfABCDGE type electron transport complex subunit D [Lachnospiraceae bacterium]NCC00845.1 RnfABCDGE type electron transport complex subunit D [Clostridia bacterium]NCD02075.1 RnfABCDGE type electron transport complex subunit D [Clostridia bacterium]
MDGKLIVSSSPHISSPVKTKNIMLDVIIALIPALIASIYYFGPRAILVVCVTVAACVISEFISRKVMKRSQTIGDLSAVVTGILLAFNYPVGLPLWIAAIGGVVAIVMVKQMFGGLGHNFANPAITARIILMTSFALRMTTWVAPFAWRGTVDATSTATPLAIMASGQGELPTYLQMFLGERAGTLGETCIVALLIGGIYLVAKKVISPIIPVCYIATVFVFSAILGQDPVMQILSGGLFLGAIFMATDYVTCPITNKGKVIYALGCGIITVMIRQFGSLPEGVSFSILLMNILTPHIENLTTPKAFGVGKEASK